MTPTESAARDRDAGGTRPAVAVLGGGISGVATAFYLARASADLPAEKQPVIRVFEATDQLGGPVGTERVDGWLLERGPDSFLSNPPSVVNLARDLGLGDEIITPHHCHPSLYLWRKGLRAMPADMALVVPGNIEAFMRSDLLSWAGKARVMVEPLLPGSVGMPPTGGDISLGELFRSRLGQEMVDVVVAPILAGIYSGDIDQLSLMSTFPRFADMVRQHGSLLQGARHAVAKRREAQLLETGVGEPGQVPSHPFRSLRRGVGSLMEALVRAVEQDEQIGIQRGHRVVALDGTPGDWTVTLDRDGDPSTFAADEVVLATPAWVSSALLSVLCPESAQALHKIQYTSTVGVYLGYRLEGFDMPQSAGILLPRDGTFEIKGIQLGANKYPGRAPDGHGLFRVFLGGVGREQVLRRSDADLVRICQRDLDALLGVKGEPMITRVIRYRRRSPQYTVGHCQRARRALDRLPKTLHLVGAGYQGIGLPACVRSARDTALDIVDRILPSDDLR